MEIKIIEGEPANNLDHLRVSTSEKTTHNLKIHYSGCEQQTEIYSKAQIELKISWFGKIYQTQPSNDGQRMDD